jgi:hypothetical protein
MRVHVETVLPCPPDRVWAEVQTARLLWEVIDPFLRFEPVGGEAFPERWESGMTVRGRAYAFGRVPLGLHTIYYERVDHERREIQTREHGGLLRRWDHRMSVRPAPGRRTLYADEVEVEAGLLTPVVWAYAQFFYRHRQRRWRRIARRLARGASR